MPMTPGGAASGTVACAAYSCQPLRSWTTLLEATLLVEVFKNPFLVTLT